MQEALRGQIADLERLLPGYGWFGRGRDRAAAADGGEFNPVFYAKDRLRLLEQATFWLSATPDVAGSRGWDGACNRIVTWGKLEEIATGRVFPRLQHPLRSPGHDRPPRERAASCSADRRDRRRRARRRDRAISTAPRRTSPIAS